jgi:lipopolysaccharide export system permease protein
MKILDRYVLWMFLRNYVISLMVLIGLYVVMDMVFNFDELAEVGEKTAEGGAELAVLRHILSYYGYRVFPIFAQLSGIIPVVAAAFTVIRLVRFNEMTAILAAGVPLLRVAMPIIIAALVTNVLLIVDQELLIPRMIPMLTRTHDQTEARGASFAVRSMEDGENRLVVAAEYRPGGQASPPQLVQLSVIGHDGQFHPVSHLSADRATWDEQARLWRLSGGKIVNDLSSGRRLTPEPVEIYQSQITPEEIALYRSGDYVDLLPTSRIKELIARRAGYGMVDLQRVMHARFTQWVLNLVLLLLAVGTLLTRDPGRLKLGIMQCVGVTGGCMTAIFLSQQLAGTPPAGSGGWVQHWPAIMAWLPILIFGPVAVWLLDRVRT